MADTKHKKIEPGHHRFERSDANFVLIGIWMIIIIILAVLTAFATWGYFNYFYRQQLAESMARRSPLLADDQVVQTIPGPELQVNPAAVMQVFNVQQNKDLNEYNWINREAGIVRLPIDVAKKKVIDQGLLKSRAQDPESTATVPDDGASLPQDSSSGRTYWNLQR